MKTTTSFLSCALILMLSATCLRAQFVLTASAESVQVYSQWGREKPMKKDSPKVLQLRIENSNPAPVEVSFEINFIDELQIVETSKVQTVKISAGKPGKPKRVKLKFKPASYNPEDIDDVDVAIEEVSLRK